MTALISGRPTSRRYIAYASCSPEYLLHRARWTSVVRGAVLCEYMSLGNRELINTRLPRWNYGVRFKETFDPLRHDPKDKEKDERTGQIKARNQIAWLIKRVMSL